MSTGQKSRLLALVCDFYTEMDLQFLKMSRCTRYVQYTRYIHCINRYRFYICNIGIFVVKCNYVKKDYVIPVTDRGGP
jgi:hypothetical protein